MKDETKIDGLNDPQTTNPDTKWDVTPLEVPPGGDFPIEPPNTASTPPVHIDPPPPPAYK